MLFQALQSITRISVVEGSMTYQDPAFQSQNTMMALQAGMTLLQAGYQIDVIAIYRRLLGFLGFKDASKIAPDAPAMATSPMAGRTPASPPVPDGGGVPPSPPPSPMQ